MSRLVTQAGKTAVIIAFALTLGGCVVAPPRYYVGGTVSIAPPAPRVEYYGSPPYPGYLWIGGYWRFGPGRYVWAPGHWAAPRPGYRWMPRHWVRGPRGWHLAGGRWARR